VGLYAVCLWPQPFAQLASARGQSEQASAPVGIIDAALDQPFTVHLIDKLPGAGAIDAKARRKTVLIDVRLVGQVAQRGILERRQIRFGGHIRKDSRANLKKSAGQRRRDALDWHSALKDHEVAGPVAINGSFTRHTVRSLMIRYLIIRILISFRLSIPLNVSVQAQSLEADRIRKVDDRQLSAFWRQTFWGAELISSAQPTGARPPVSGRKRRCPVNEECRIGGLDHQDRDLEPPAMQWPRCRAGPARAGAMPMWTKPHRRG
jgi:hypothetical protein